MHRVRMAHEQIVLEQVNRMKVALGPLLVAVRQRLVLLKCRPKVLVRLHKLRPLLDRVGMLAQLEVDGVLLAHGFK